MSSWSGCPFLLAIFEPGRGCPQQFRRSGQIPVGVHGRKVSQVDAQMGKQFRDVLASAMPQCQALYGKAMPKGVERNFRLARSGLDPSVPNQSHEGAARGVVAKWLSVPTRKKR